MLGRTGDSLLVKGFSPCFKFPLTVESTRGFSCQSRRHHVISNVVSVHTRPDSSLAKPCHSKVSKSILMKRKTHEPSKDKFQYTIICAPWPRNSADRRSVVRFEEHTQSGIFFARCLELRLCLGELGSEIFSEVALANLPACACNTTVMGPASASTGLHS